MVAVVVNYRAVFVRVGVKGVLLYVGFDREWLFLIESLFITRDNGLNVLIRFKGFLLFNKVIRDLGEGKMEIWISRIIWWNFFRKGREYYRIGSRKGSLFKRRLRWFRSISLNVFNYLFNKYLLKSYYVFSKVLKSWEYIMINIDMVLFLESLEFNRKCWGLVM